MTPERWRRINEIFNAALDQPPSRLDGFVREECGSDEDLRLEIGRMLDEHARDGLLDQSPVAAAGLREGPVFADGQLVAGRYRIVRFLNRGGMGEVYEADDQELRERVALKTLLPAIASDTRMIARFKQEIQLARRISHPNVCRVFDLSRHPAAGSSPGATVFLTMEFLAGETLAAKLKRERRMSCAAALPLLQQMAAALDAAHRAGVIHRDFKPSNVMLVPAAEGTRAIVTDFGLARSFVSREDRTVTLSNAVVGTLDYMAPELLSNEPASAASDVYALGMTAYRMVAGTLPFSSETPLAGAILRGKVPVPSPRSVAPNVDAHWDRAILRAIERDSARRFSRTPEFVDALRGETASVTVPLPVMTRRRLVLTAVCVLGIVASAMGLRAWMRARRTPPAEAVKLFRTGVDDIRAGAFFAATRALGQAVAQAPHYGLAHARLAEAWAELDLTERAKGEMIPALREDNSNLSQIDRLLIDAVSLRLTREFPAAVAKYEQMRKLAPDDPDVDMDLGRAYEIAGQPSKAIESYRRVANGPSHNPAAWLRLAILYDRRMDRAHADAAFSQAEQLYQLTSNLEGLTEVNLRQGQAADGRRNYEDAAKLLGKALETARISRNVHQEIRAELQFATHFYQSGDTARSEQFAREALEIARANQMEYFAIGGINVLGQAYRAKQDYDGAEKQFKDGLEIARRTNSERMMAVNLLTLASLHDKLGRSAESAQEAEEALHFFQPNGFALQTVQALVIMGRFQRNRGNLDGAQKLFQQASQAAEIAGDHTSMSLTHQSLASLLTARDNYPAARVHLQKGLDVSSDARDRASARLVLGDNYRLLGEYDAARKIYDAADADAVSFPSVRFDLTRNRAQLELSEGHYALAASLSRGAIAEAKNDPALKASLQLVLGPALIAAGARREGLRTCEEALAATEKSGDVSAILNGRLVLAQAQIDTGNRAAALQLLMYPETVLASRPEHRWRVLALQGNSGGARQALEDLHRAWGDAAFERYSSRPDIQKLARPLFLVVNAK